MRDRLTAFLRATILATFGLAAVTSSTAAQSETIAPGPTLVAEGIPSIPASLAADVRRYAESRGAALEDWHPIRRELLIATRFANSNQIHAVKAPGGARTQLTFADEPITTATYQPPREDTSSSPRTSAETNSTSSIATTCTRARPRF